MNLQKITQLLSDNFVPFPENRERSRVDVKLRYLGALDDVSRCIIAFNSMISVIRTIRINKYKTATIHNLLIYNKHT